MEIISRKIKDIALYIKTGSTPSTTNALNFEEPNFNWFTPGDFSESKIVLKESSRKISEYATTNSATIFDPRTILITCIGDIGNSGIIERNSSANQQITGVLVDENIINPYLFNYLIRYNKQKIKDKANQAVVAILNNKNLREIEIDFPSNLEDQNKIVSVLDKAKSILDKKEKQLEHFDTLMRSTFLEMFGDPVINPKEWSTKTLADLVAPDCPITYGIVQPGDDYPNGIPVVRPVDLKQRYVTLEGLKLINPKISEKYKRTVLKGGEILLSVRGTTGTMSIASQEIAGANVTRGIAPLWFGIDMNKTFAFEQLKSLSIQNKIQELTYGAALQQINLKDLREIKLIQPNIELQEKFEKIALLIDNQIRKLKQSQNKLNELINSISQLAFKGELEFNTAVDLEVLLENDYTFFKANSNIKSIKLLLERLDKNELNEKKFSDQEIYDKAKGFVFELLKEGKVKQVFDEKTKRVKLTF